MMADDQQPAQVVVGVDTHDQVHVAAVVDRVGRELGHQAFATTPAGYAQLLAWAQDFGVVGVVGVEGTGAYGAGLCRFLLGQQLGVVEVDRPDRKARRFQGKSDPLDAYAAARAALSGRAATVPKTRDGTVEMIRTLRVARRSAVKAATQAKTQLTAVIKTAPAELREQLRGLAGRALVAGCAQLAPAPLVDPTAACIYPLHQLARRIQVLEAELAELDAALGPLVRRAAPRLVGCYGVGVEVASQLLVTAGDNPDRLHSEAAFAHLCGVAPLPASSGKTQRHRLM
jgi:transposase